ncbi:MAG: hypothetical protein AAF500_18865 [Myxococcota bacterium]
MQDAFATGSQFTAMIAVFGVTIANLFLYVMIERWMFHRAEAVLTGRIRDQEVPHWYRRFYLFAGVTTPYAVGLGAQTIFTVGYVMMARSAPSEAVGLYLWMYAFFSGIGVTNWLASLPLWFFALRRVLREERET